MRSLKVLLVDDHALFLEGMRNFLKLHDIEVVGMAKNGLEAFLKYEMLQPDIVLMDLKMAECDGIEATQRIKKEYPQAKIVILTATEDEEHLVAALQAGASGFLLKGMDPEDFFYQLTNLAEGELPLAPGLMEQVLQNVISSDELEETDYMEQDLTGRQKEILRLLVRGFTYRAIGQQLNVKESTIKYHVNQILAKLCLENRSQLISYAIRNGII